MNGVDGCLECALGWPHWWAVPWLVLDSHCLNSFSCNRFTWSILPEEFRVGHCGIVKCNMVVHGSIKVLSVSRVSHIVIFGAFHIEIWNPAEFAIDVSILWNNGVVRHSGAFDFIHLIRVMFSSWFYKYGLFLLEVLVKIKFVVRMICSIEHGRRVVMSFVPLIIIWSQHSIVGILINNYLCGIFNIWRVLSSHLGMCSKDICQPFASKRWFSIQTRYWGSELWINYNVFCVWHAF